MIRRGQRSLASLKKFYGRYQHRIEKFQSQLRKCWMTCCQDNLYFTYGTILVVLLLYMDLSLGFVDTFFDRYHAWGRWCLPVLSPEKLVVLLAGPISYTGIQYMNFVEITNVLLDLSAIYFACFSGCWASLVSSCYPVLWYYNLFSRVKLSIRSSCFIYDKYYAMQLKSVMFDGWKNLHREKESQSQQQIPYNRFNPIHNGEEYLAV